MTGGPPQAPLQPRLQHFAPVLNLIRQAQSRALHSVNRELIELYWQVGEYLHRKTEQPRIGVLQAKLNEFYRADVLRLSQKIKPYFTYCT